MPHRVVGLHDPYALTPPDVDVIGTRVAAKTISTYPMNTAHTKRVKKNHFNKQLKAGICFSEFDSILRLFYYYHYLFVFLFIHL